MRRKKIAVIGGGIAGICSIASLKSEGLEPVCFEKSDKFGGTWYYKKEASYGQASIMPTTIQNSSKEVGALSTFPPRKEYSNYMKHSECYKYITDYVESHNCLKYMHFNTEVLHVKRTEDYPETGRWYVITKNLVTGKVDNVSFDGVLVCTGHMHMPIMPSFPGQDIFFGKIMHSHSLKEVDKFLNKNVVIVGMGNSAVDAAVEISHVAKQVYLSTRTGAYVISRVGQNGLPVDIITLRRFLLISLNFLPVNFVYWAFETIFINNLFNQKLCRIESKYHALSRDPVINDHFLEKLLTGEVIQKGNIKHFTEKGVVFRDEETVTEVDAVIMATGYTWGYPFLEEDIIVKEEGRFNLYKCMYPSHLPHPTLAIIGFLLPFGPGFPLGEMQSRWASYLLATDGKLPSEDIMMKNIIGRHKANFKRYKPCEKLSVRIDYLQYMDDIANELSVKPKVWKYIFTDFHLFLKLIFGPVLSYQYRLEGRGKWTGAKEAILSSKDRILWPLRKGRPIRKGLIGSFMAYVLNLMPLNIDVCKF